MGSLPGTSLRGTWQPVAWSHEWINPPTSSNITTPLRLLFWGGPYQNVKYLRYIKIHKIHCLGPPPLNVKLVAERPQGVDFVGRVSKIPSTCKLTCSRPPSKTKNTLKRVAYILGTSHPLKTVVIFQHLPTSSNNLQVSIYVHLLSRSWQCHRTKLEPIPKMVHAYVSETLWPMDCSAGVNLESDALCQGFMPSNSTMDLARSVAASLGLLPVAEKNETPKVLGIHLQLFKPSTQTSGAPEAHRVATCCNQSLPPYFSTST